MYWVTQLALYGFRYFLRMVHSMVVAETHPSALYLLHICAILYDLDWRISAPHILYGSCLRICPKTFANHKCALVIPLRVSHSLSLYIHILCIWMGVNVFSVYTISFDHFSNALWSYNFTSVSQIRHRSSASATKNTKLVQTQTDTHTHKHWVDRHTRTPGCLCIKWPV